MNGMTRPRHLESQAFAPAPARIASAPLDDRVHLWTPRLTRMTTLRMECPSPAHTPTDIETDTSIQIGASACSSRPSRCACLCHYVVERGDAGAGTPTPLLPLLPHARRAHRPSSTCGSESERMRLERWEVFPFTGSGSGVCRAGISAISRRIPNPNPNSTAPARLTPSRPRSILTHTDDTHTDDTHTDTGESDSALTCVCTHACPLACFVDRGGADTDSPAPHAPRPQPLIRARAALKSPVRDAHHRAAVVPWIAGRVRVCPNANAGPGGLGTVYRPLAMSAGVGGRSDVLRLGWSSS
ncbi:hypothetical protein B0H11DRAFT_20321 [Mycena galericulata]|nr:hypothetical protein B0H11DRAFT_20321 [Mycena galericulata]